jgi:hypothetical protein
MVFPKKSYVLVESTALYPEIDKNASSKKPVPIIFRNGLLDECGM